MGQHDNNSNTMNARRQQLMYYDDYRAMQEQALGTPIENAMKPVSVPFDRMHPSMSRDNIQYSQQYSNIPQSFFQKDLFYKEHSIQAAIYNGNVNNRPVYSSIVSQRPDCSAPVKESLMYNGVMRGALPGSAHSTSTDFSVGSDVISSTTLGNTVDLGNTISGNIRRSEEGQSALKSLDAVNKAGMFSRYMS